MRKTLNPSDSKRSSELLPQHKAGGGDARKADLRESQGELREGQKDRPPGRWVF